MKRAIPLSRSLLLCTSLVASGAAAFSQERASAAPAQQPADQVVSAEQGYSWSDYDGDGYVDLLRLDTEGGFSLMRNDGRGGFEDFTELSGLTPPAETQSVLGHDLDGDGHLDLLFAAPSGEGRLFWGSASGIFDAGGPADGHEMMAALEAGASSADALDYDLDGAMDLLLSSATGEQLFRGTGRLFLPVSLSLRMGASISQVQISLSRLAFPCANSIKDVSNPGACLKASSMATLGMLYPISTEWFIDATTGFVGIGTVNPTQALDVNGMIRSRSGGIQFPDGTQQTTATLQGPQGPAGSQGADGIQGPQGPMGTTGNPGIPGQTGATGAIGAQGLIGAQGATGLQGPQGSQGPIGNQGPTGPAGSDSLWTTSGQGVQLNGGSMSIASTDPSTFIQDASHLRTGNIFPTPFDWQSFTQLQTGRQGSVGVYRRAGGEPVTLFLYDGEGISGVLLNQGSLPASTSDGEQVIVWSQPVQVTAGQKYTIELTGTVGADLNWESAFVNSYPGGTGMFGWDNSFSTQILDPTSTFLDADPLGNTLRVVGPIRMGSESNNNATPGLGSDYKGMIVRRVQPYALDTGRLIASAGAGRARLETLYIGGGIEVGLRLTLAGSSSGTYFCRGTYIDGYGVLKAIFVSGALPPVGMTSVVEVIPPIDRSSYVDLIFGIQTNGDGEHYTEVTLARNSLNDPVWRGSLTSSEDQ